MCINMRNISLNSAYIIRFFRLTIVFSSNVMNEQTVMKTKWQTEIISCKTLFKNPYALRISEIPTTCTCKLATCSSWN